MKRIIIAAFLILAAAVAGIVQIRTSQLDTDFTAKTTKVGVLLNGIRGDHSYCQSHYEALESLKDELNLQFIYQEQAPPNCYRDIVRLVQEEGCRIIIGISFEFGPAMDKAAETFPDVYFLHATGTGHRNNLASFFGRMYQARYLSGIAAGMKTKTGDLGYVAAFPIPEVIRGINAFTQGVRSVRPDATVHVRYCGSWVKDEPAERACKDLLKNHPIDVMAMHVNSLQPHRVAEMQGILSIGYNLDNAATFPDTYLTACVWKWDVYYRKQILNCLQDKFHGNHLWMNMEDGIVALSKPTKHIDDQTMTKVITAAERLRTREFDVFYGPIKDNKGRVRVEAGESMSDDEMLLGFNWYVEGVAIEGQGMDGA